MQFLKISAVFAVLLASLMGTEAPAQDENEACPCFSYEEVESIFLSAAQFTAQEGTSSCNAEDYSVECKAEVVIWDQNFTVIAQASVNWYDFDPSRCDYLDTLGNPGIERNLKWPHPAPEDTARACFDIISRAIANSVEPGKCSTYP